jgi:hypothetical protein
VRHDQFRRKAVQHNQGVAFHAGDRLDPALEGVPTGLGQRQPDGQQAERHAARRPAQVPRRPHVDAFLEIEFLRFLRHLPDGGVIEGGGKIGQMPVFAGQFHDPQQAVAQPAVFLLHQHGQRPPVAPPPNPMPRPGQHGPRRSGQSAQEKQDPQPDRSFPEPVGKENRQQGKKEAGRDAAGRRGGFDPPKALLDLFKLPAQPFGQIHRRIIFVLRHGACVAHTQG